MKGRKCIFWTLSLWTPSHPNAYYVTLHPKLVISEPNGPKIIQFDIHQSNSKNVS